jgi:hypothetical protein
MHVFHTHPTTLLFEDLNHYKIYFKVKGTLFCDVMLCSPVEVKRLFGGRYCLHLQGRSYAKKQKASSALLNLKMEAAHSSAISVNFYWSTSVTSQRKVLFMVTVVRTPNPV